MSAPSCFAISLTASLALGLTASASPSEDLQELGLSEMAYTQEQGELQLTLVSGLRRADEATRLEFGVGVEYGLTDDLQFEVSLPTVIGLGADREPAQVDRVELGVGWAVLRAGGFTLTPMFEVGLGEDPVLEASVVAHQLLGSVHLNLQVGVELDVEAREAQAEAALAAYLALGPITPILEVKVELEDGEAEALAAGGLAWRPADGYELMATGFVSLAREVEEGGALLTLIGEWEFGDDDDDDDDPWDGLTSREEDRP